MNYILKNVNTEMYFKGYSGKGKGPKPTWTNQIDDAVRYDMYFAMRIKRRLFCQSQFVELIPLEGLSVTLPDSPTKLTAYFPMNSSELRGTSISESPKEAKLDDFAILNEEFLKKAVLPFMGVPLRIDESLKHGQYYIAVSQDLFERIEEEGKRTTEKRLKR